MLLFWGVLCCCGVVLIVIVVDGCLFRLCLCCGCGFYLLLLSFVVFCCFLLFFVVFCCFGCGRAYFVPLARLICPSLPPFARSCLCCLLLFVFCLILFDFVGFVVCFL